MTNKRLSHPLSEDQMFKGQLLMEMIKLENLRLLHLFSIKKETLNQLMRVILSKERLLTILLEIMNSDRVRENQKDYDIIKIMNA